MIDQILFLWFIGSEKPCIYSVPIKRQSYDIEWYTISTTDSDYIGEAKAKQIVEQAAGTTGVYTDFKLEVDDGRVLYEGEMRSGWMEYEFEIDAVTGAIIDWEADWD